MCTSRWPKMDELARQVLEADRAGKTRKALSKEIGIDDGALSVICKYLDIPPPPPISHWTKIFSDHSDKTAPEIAKIVGISRENVRQAAIRHGVHLPHGKPGRK